MKISFDPIKIAVISTIYSGLSCAGAVHDKCLNRYRDKVENTSPYLDKCLEGLVAKVLKNSVFAPLELQGNVSKTWFALMPFTTIYQFSVSDPERNSFIGQLKVELVENATTDYRAGKVVSRAYTCSTSTVNEAFKLFNQVGDLVESWNIPAPSSSWGLGGGLGCD